MPEFSLPLFAGLDAPRVPYQGTCRDTRSASFSGAVAALDHRGEKLAKLYAFIREHGPVTLNEMAAGLGYPLSSICSLHAALKPQLEPAGHQIVKVGRHPTKRTQWRVKR